MRLGVHHPKLIGAIEMMEANIEEPLTRRCWRATSACRAASSSACSASISGAPPAQYYLELRLERARHLLYQTTMPIMNVAFATGFVSASHFSTCYRQMYGRTPRARAHGARLS